MKRLITIVMLMMMTLLLATVVAAQDTPVFCGDLAPEDCAILEQSEAAMAAIDSASTTFEFNLSISGVPDIPDPSTIAITGSGSFANGSAFNPLTDVSEDAEITTILSTLATALQGFNGQLSLNITIPPELAEDVPSSIDLNLRLVDGVGYIDFDALQPVINDPSFTGWGGLDFSGMINYLLEQQPELFSDESMSGAFSEGFSSGFAMGSEEFSDPARLANFVSIQRLDDEAGAAVFETTVNLAALMQDPEFVDMMRQQMESQGQSMTDADFSQMLTMMNGMFDNSSVVVRQAIDPSTGFVLSTSGAINIDMSSVAELSEDTSGATPIINIDFTVNTTDVNATAPVTAPEGASLFPYQMMLGSAMSQ
ncbi:MAG: hypothetical protein K8L99_34800 [Anaerolineae bacterium]|nr:hypothetical protein [Anaerolineae bacterium]